MCLKQVVCCDLQHKAASIDASIVVTILPVVTMLLAAVFLREPITQMKAVGVLVMGVDRFGYQQALLAVLVFSDWSISSMFQRLLPVHPCQQRGVSNSW